MTPEPPADVDDVILAYLNAVDAGGTPDPADWLARYPLFADQLRPFFAVESRIGRVAAGTHANAHDDTPTPAVDFRLRPALLELGDRYDEIEPIGRGGMGDVVRVRDKVLGRTVAVKVLQRRHQAHPDRVARFLDEARIAGSLQHPGVPSVHDIGTAPDGRPFLVMRLIAGATLADRLRRRPDPAHDLPWFLKAFEQVAQTVAYAHSRGVLHRDLKPHNVMVGAFGEVQVMDWGLARVLTDGREPPAGGDTSPVRASSFRTMVGTAVGTPAYMAPEQARGGADRLDTRADVFGLGAILCEVLTGQPPFTGGDALEQAKRADVTAARARLDAAACDADLRTLARRCLAPDPADRPADAQAVATAMAEYLAGVQDRLRQSELAVAKAAAVRRQRRVARGFGALAGVLLVLGLTGVLVVQARANDTLTHKNAELAEANERERLRFNLALDAIDLFHGDVSRDLILKEKQFAPLRTKMLRGAADFYAKLEAQLGDRDDPTTQAAMARSYRQLGGLYHTLGGSADAAAAFEKALTIQRRLVALPDAKPESKWDLAATLFSLAWVQIDTRPTEVGPVIAEAQSLVESIDGGAETTAEREILRADILFVRGTSAYHAVRFDEARAQFAAAVALLEPFVRANPRNVGALSRLGQLHVQLGQAAPDTDGTQRHTRAAMASFRAMLDLDPRDPAARREVAHCRVVLGMTSDAAELPLDEVVANLEAGRDLAAGLVAEYPFVSDFRRVLALGQHHLAGRYLLLNRLPEARATVLDALANWQLLADGSPDVAPHRVLRARSRTVLATIDRETGRPAEALAGLTLAAGELDAVIAETKSDVYRAFRAYTVRQIGLVHLAEGRLREAAEATTQARDAFAPLRATVTHLPRLRVELAACHATLSELAGRPDSGVPPGRKEAEAARAMEILNSDLNDFYPHPLALTRDRGFDSLRGRSDFKRFTDAAPVPNRAAPR